jgi:5'-3' exonuclease
MLRKAVDLLKYDQIGVGGLEADDVIGILSRQWPGAVIIYSNDHDMYQLLEQGRVEVFCPDGKERAGLSGCKRIDQQGVEREYGVPIKHWPRYLALGGDTSDDVKPLLGVGPKGAARLVQEGARPDWPFRKHDCAFRKKYRWYESAWVKVQHAYEVVCIPRRASDARIVHLTQGARLRPRERGSVDEAAVAGFTTFCADLDLVDFLSIRRDFFYGSACSVD